MMDVMNMHPSHNSQEKRNTAQNKLPNWLAIAIVVLVLASILFRLLLTETAGFIMDELVDVNLAYQVGNGLKIYQDVLWERTPLMTYILSWVISDAESSLAAVLAARKVMWLASGILFFLVYMGGRRICGGLSALAAPLMLLSFSTFLDRAIRVRADLISTLLATPALLLLMAPRLGPLSQACAGLCLGLAFITTQKAAYFVLAFALGLICRVLFETRFGLVSLKRILGYGFVSALCFFVPVLVLGFFMSQSGRLHVFLEQCFFGATDMGLVNQTYSSTRLFVGQTVSRNPLFWGLGIAGMAILISEAIKEWRKQQPIANSASAAGLALGTWTFAMLVAISFHTVKFPYLFLNVSVCLALCAALPLARSLEAASGRPWDWTHWSLAIGAFFCLVFAPYTHHARNMRSAHFHRVAAVMARVDLITTPQDHVLDGIGIATIRRKATPYSFTARWYNDRQAGADYPVLGYLKQKKPVVAIMNYRLDRLEPAERAFIDKYYIQDWANIHVLGANAQHPGGEPGRHRIHILASHPYAVLARDRSKLRLDGKVPKGIEVLSAGEHELVIEGEPQDVTIKYLPSVKIAPPRPVPAGNLFPGYDQ